ncbi:hypothetical protein [Cognatazoarcus halotolerans]|uniref:hypothetical protein n=1 Tax=Cognatazoarcus halotolerans TaxID=2686016 RepID=UPI001358DFFF|nr:hypothetical protein [Cognatazoarcus halotolerans]MBX3679536.1 hypothetical protein [Rhodocyclaceae bacterium]MCB1900377.1 hypothetical protein [Rhodocyclaceae bacterium]MCP5308212.1 hypothetical protein [Zoogloeaceae bacterium]
MTAHTHGTPVHHDHAEPRATLLTSGLGQRLVAVSGLAALLWLTVFWVLAGS